MNSERERERERMAPPKRGTHGASHETRLVTLHPDSTIGAPTRSPASPLPASHPLQPERAPRVRCPSPPRAPSPASECPVTALLSSNPLGSSRLLAATNGGFAGVCELLVNSVKRKFSGSTEHREWPACCWTPLAPAAPAAPRACSRRSTALSHASRARASACVPHGMAILLTVRTLCNVRRCAAAMLCRGSLSSASCSCSCWTSCCCLTSS